MRPLEVNDADRVTELVESTLTTSYRLSPQQIEMIGTELFAAEALEERLDRPDVVLRVAEADDEEMDAPVVGYVEGIRDGTWGEVRWLFVDPEHRGQGIGTELFETARDQLLADGADTVGASMLEANTEGHDFVERFGLERVGEDRIEISGERLTSYVYADPDADVEPPDADEESADEDEELPETEVVDGQLTATTDDGQQVYIDQDEELSGTEGPFFIVYAEPDGDDQFGHYCSNCGSLETTMGSMERIECEHCGNSSASRGSADYDDSYL